MYLHSFPTRRSSDLAWVVGGAQIYERVQQQLPAAEEDRIFRLQLQVQTLPEVRERSLQFIGRVISARPNEVPEDRKSTRLNSSHVAISYAVFCLKI